jgi:hypothetical protein
MTAQPTDRSSILRELKDAYANRQSQSLIPFLPLFSIHGRPMSLDKHYVMEPIFKLQQPKRLVLLCGRQEGKSLSLATQSILQTAAQPHFHTLFIQPRCDQIEYFADTYITPMINNFAEDLLDNSRKQNILQKSFYNGSDMYFSYAFLDAERVRGKSYIAKVVLDEYADIFPDTPEIAGECMSAQEEFGFFVFSGTPKTADNPLSLRWNESSQAEWLIKCRKCNYENIPNLKNDALRMIGKTGPICAKCGKGLDVSTGFYYHNVPHKRNAYAGYHIPQIIHPIHANNPNKWKDLLDKQANWKPAKFQNEVLGEPCDESVSPITEADLRAATNKYNNVLSEAVEIRKGYDAVVMGVDWSGFGAENVSTTTLAVVGVKPGTDVVDTLYVERFKPNLNPEEEARILMDYGHLFNITYLAHDFTGAGMIREATMVQKGFTNAQIIPFQLVFSPANKNIITFYNPPSGGRTCWNIDKTRSLMLLFEMIKRKKVTFPDWNKCKDVLCDLLAIIQETRETPRGSEFTIMLKKPKLTDDCAHAVNFACSAIWHIRGQYPSLAEDVFTNTKHISADEFKLMDPSIARWDAH